jgi:TP901 family phage tail tape measure protein
MSRVHNVTIRYNSNVTGLKSAETELRRLEQLVDQIEADPVNLAGNSPAQLKALKDQIMELRVANQKFKNGAKDAFDQYNTDVKMANKLMAQLAAQHRQTTEELEKQERAQDALNRSEDRRLSILNRTKRALGQSFLEAPLYSASFALMAGIGTAIQQYIEFDKVLTRIGIVSERSAESMKTFKDMAIETGRALGTTGKAFAEASLIFIQQGGLAADNASALAEASIKLANITGARAEDTSDYITAIANSFNMLETEGSRAGERIVDMLAELDAATGTSADEIANAFKKSASSFAVSGFSPEESAAMLAVISETTRQAPELIGTGMKTLIGNLAEVRIGSKEFEGITNKLQDLTKQFGISFSLVDEYTGDVKDVRTLISEVAEIYNTVNSNAAKNAIIEAVAGKEQRDRFIALVENWERVAEVTDIATNSTGAAERANDRYLDSLGAKIEILKADFEALINEIISSDWFKDLLDTTSALLRNFTTLVSEGNAFLNILNRISAVLLPIAAMKILPGGIASISALAAGVASGAPGGILKTAMRPFTGLMAPRDKDGNLLPEEPDKKAERHGKLGGRIAGVGLAAVAAVPNIVSTATNENLLASEKTVSIIGSLLPAIGSLFGPIGMLVGMLAGMALSFKSVNEEAAQVRAEMKEMTTRVNEAFATSGAEIEQLVEVITRPAADKNSYAYIEASNKLAELLPDIALGQDDYGNAILRDTEYITKLVELKKQELELEKETQALKLPELIETATKLQEQALAAGFEKVAGGSKQDLYTTKQEFAQITDGIGQLKETTQFLSGTFGAKEYSVEFSPEELRSGIYKTSEAYEYMSDIAKKSLEEQVIAMKESELKAEAYGLQIESYGQKLLDFYSTAVDVTNVQTPEDRASAQRGMEAFFSGEENVTRGTGQFVFTGQGYEEVQENAQDRLDAILALPAAKQEAAYLQFYKDFAEQFAKVGKDLAARKTYLDQLTAGHSSIFQQFMYASKEQREKILTENGFKKEDYDRVLEAALGNIEGMQKEFERFQEEQQKMIISGEITGTANPLQTLFDSLAATSSTAAGDNIKGQIGNIVSTIQSSKKPLAQQYQELLEIQLEYWRISEWINKSGADYLLDDSEKRALAGLGLKKLSVNLQEVTAMGDSAKHLLNKELVSNYGPGGEIYKGIETDISLNEFALPEGEEKATGGGVKRDPIADILGMYDTERAERQRAISDAEKQLAKLTEGTTAYRKQLKVLRDLRSADAVATVDENKSMSDELNKYQNDIKLTEEKIDKLQDAQKKDPRGELGIFTDAMREQLAIYEKLIEAQKKLTDDTTKLIDLTEKLENLQAKTPSLEGRIKTFKEGSKAQRAAINETAQHIREEIKITEELRKENQETIKDIRAELAVKGISPEDREIKQGELNKALALDAQYTNEIFANEEKIYNLRKLSYDQQQQNISTNIAKLESQLGNRIEQSAEYLKIQDMIIEQQRQIYVSNQNRLKDIENRLKTQAMTESERALYINEQNELYVTQRNLMDQINESIKKRAVDEYNIALYGTANMDALNTQFEIRQRLIDEIIDSHESLIERTQLELEIQKEIEDSTNQAYKTNLKYLQNKIKDVRLTKQIIDATRAQINLLKVLSGEQTTGPLRLTRAAGGQFRFAPSAGEAGGRQASLEAAAQYEKESIDRYRELSNNVFNVEQQIAQMMLGGQDVTEATALLGELRAQRIAQGEEVTKAKTVSALIAEGRSPMAARLLSGRISTAEGLQMLSPQQRRATAASAQGELSAVISSEQLLIQSNFSIVTSNYKLIDAIKAFQIKIGQGFDTSEMRAIAAAAPDFYEEKGIRAIGTTLTGAKIYGAGTDKALGAELFKRLTDDPLFRATEIGRAAIVMAEFKNATDPEGKKRYNDAEAYLARISKMETGGYTGDFQGGRVAMLHEKELVLNKMDTRNILNAVAMTRNMPHLTSGFSPNMASSTSMGQNVVINAEFPNVSSADEIKKAFSSMSTKALQYAYRTKSF